MSRFIYPYKTAMHLCEGELAGFEYKIHYVILAIGLLSQVAFLLFQPRTEFAYEVPFAAIAMLAYILVPYLVLKKEKKNSFLRYLSVMNTTVLLDMVMMYGLLLMGVTVALLMFGEISQLSVIFQVGNVVITLVSIVLMIMGFKKLNEC